MKNTAPKLSLEVLVESDLWSGVDLAAAVDPVLRAMMNALGLQEMSVSVLLCHDTRIAALNEAFRGKPVPTNVLSWPSGAFSDAWEAGKPFDRAYVTDPEIGDIAISFETMEREARAANLRFEDHLAHLSLHGVLHCLGFDHVTDTQADYMEGLERKILATCGLHDPYITA
ncbi:MAG: rRNA maturation RNase YbeY [Pseudomonadota bacterium]